MRVLLAALIFLSAISHADGTFVTAGAIPPSLCTTNQFANAILSSGSLGCGAITQAVLPSPASTPIASTAIDWSQLNKIGGVYTKTLGGNTTFTFSNQTAGETIVVRITNTSTYTVTWPTVKWPGGSAPVQTTGAHTDIYTFVYDGSNTYGTAVQNF
jgi:hypothetical protein